jgi:hypothetical protein
MGAVGVSELPSGLGFWRAALDRVSQSGRAACGQMTGSPKWLVLVAGLAVVVGRIPLVNAQRTEIPPAIAALVPQGFEVVIFANTKLTPTGESLVEYEGLGGVFEEDAHVALVRSGAVVRTFSHLADGCTAAAFGEFALDETRRAAALKFRCAGDGTGALFIVIAARARGYAVVLRQETIQGRMQIFEDNPTRLWFWSARPEFDKLPAEQSCVVCLHRYAIEELSWNVNRFVPVRRAVLAGYFEPNNITSDPIAIAPKVR